MQDNVAQPTIRFFVRKIFGDRLRVFEDVGNPPSISVVSLLNYQRTLTARSEYPGNLF